GEVCSLRIESSDDAIEILYGSFFPRGIGMGVIEGGLCDFLNCGGGSTFCAVVGKDAGTKCVFFF
ncbi:MAG: hypothetical protein IJV69_06720, partial [Kiritimatiellae bacterium]|nr:hypothetical protein [Kiritimatiellia bacterium]